MRSNLPLALMIFLIFFLGSASVIYVFSTPQISPSSPLYFLQTIKEGLEMKVAFSMQSKAAKQLEFATRRVKETENLVGEEEDRIQTVMERYWNNFQTSLNFNKSAKDKLTQINQTIESNLNDLDKIYPALSSEKAKRGVRATVSRLAFSPDIDLNIRHTGCNILQKQASDSALTQSEKAIFEIRVKDCFEL